MKQLIVDLFWTLNFGFGWFFTTFYGELTVLYQLQYLFAAFGRRSLMTFIDVELPIFSTIHIPVVEMERMLLQERGNLEKCDKAGYLLIIELSVCLI